MRNPRSPHRAALVASQIWDRLKLAVFAAGILVLLTLICTLGIAPIPTKVLSELFDKMTPYSMKLAVLLLVTELVMFLCLQKRGIPTAARQFFHLHHWIPLWRTGLSAIAIWWLALVGIPGIRMAVNIPVWVTGPLNLVLGTLLALSFLSLALHLILLATWWILGIRAKGAPGPGQSMEQVPDTPPTGGTIEASPEAFLTWARTDLPVASVSEDKFETRNIAWNIARQVLAFGPASHAVVGPLGAGKSTIGLFLREYLVMAKCSRRIRFVRIELWPYLTPEAALEGILARILDEVANEAGVLHLRTLPRQYVDVLGPLTGAWSAILRVFTGSETDPARILGRIDSLVTILGIELVVWIDDLERFAGTLTEGESSEGISRLSPIRSLLHAIGEKNSMTVVLATTSLMTGFDLSKVARFIHEVPILSPERAAEILRVFRSQCHAGSISPSAAKSLGGSMPHGAWIDPTPLSLAKGFQEASLEGNFEEHQESLIRSGGYLSAPQAMALLCQTPRALKQAIRRVHDLWELGGLRGEVQFDQLMTLCLMREGCPIGFTLLRDHWVRLQRDNENDHRFIVAQSRYDNLIKARGSSDSVDQAALASLSDRDDQAALSFLHSLYRSGLDDVNRKAVINVVEFLLWRTEKAGPQRLGRSQERQNLYWRRVLDEAPVPEPMRDQVGMRKVIRATPKELADMLADPNSAAMILDFDTSLQPVWQGVLLALVQHHWQQNWVLQNWHSDYQWVRTISRILRSAQSQGCLFWDLFHEFRVSMRHAIDLNPNMAVQIEYYFMRANEPILWSDAHASREGASCCIRDMFRERYVGRPEELAAKLIIPFALKQLCFGLEEREGGGGKDPALSEVPDWCPILFQGLVMEMTRSNDAKVALIPQFALVLVTHSNAFRMDLAEKLLGDPEFFFTQIHDQEIAGQEFFPAVRILLEVAKNAWIAKMGRGIAPLPVMEVEG